MAIKYIDLYNGNDANDGNSWATAWKTIKGGATYANLLGVEKVRISKTPDPYFVFNADWTTRTHVTIPAGHAINVEDCETAWTASANVVDANNGTGSYKKQGTYCRSITINTAFTTGKAAYKTLPATLDLSDYQQLSFLFTPTWAVPSGAITICLCSDSTGDVIVDSFTITEEFIQTGKARAMALSRTGGGNLGANINSIALYINTDLSTSANRLFYLDHFIATKLNGINLKSVITTDPTPTGGEEPRYVVLSIDQNTVRFEYYYSTGGSHKYDKIYTSNTPTYICPYFEIPSNFSTQVTTRHGLGFNYIEYEGGYEVGTETVNGITSFYDPWMVFTCIMAIHSNLKFKNFGFFRFDKAISLSSVTNIVIENIYASCGTSTIIGNGAYHCIGYKIIVGGLNVSVVDLTNSFFNEFHKMRQSSSGNRMLSLTGSSDNKFQLDCYDPNRNYFIGGTAAGRNCVFDSYEVRGLATYFTGWGSTPDTVLTILNYNRVEGANYVLFYSGKQEWRSDIKYLENPGSYYAKGSSGSDGRPTFLPIAQIPFLANKKVTATLNVKNAGARLLIRRMESIGILNDIMSEESIGTEWGQIQLEFTPTRKGVLELLLVVMPGGEIYYAPIEITQA